MRALLNLSSDPLGVVLRYARRRIHHNDAGASRFSVAKQPAPTMVSARLKPPPALLRVSYGSLDVFIRMSRSGHPELLLHGRSAVDRCQAQCILKAGRPCEPIASHLAQGVGYAISRDVSSRDPAFFPPTNEDPRALIDGDRVRWS